MVGRSTVLKLKKEQMLEFPIPESHFDTEVKKTSSTCLNLNAKKLTCNMNNIIDFNTYSNYGSLKNNCLDSPFYL